MLNDELDTRNAEQTIAITATFTAEPLERPLTFWLEELQIPARITFAPYNQVFQQLVDPSSLLATNRTGVNITLVCLEDWQRNARGAASCRSVVSGARRCRAGLCARRYNRRRALGDAAARLFVSGVTGGCDGPGQKTIFRRYSSVAAGRAARNTRSPRHFASRTIRLLPGRGIS